MNFKVRN